MDCPHCQTPMIHVSAASSYYCEDCGWDSETGGCPACGGNDISAACAYPSEGKPRCWRDKRLGWDLLYRTLRGGV